MVRKMHDNIRLYHVDHLGSTSLVTDIDGEITQHVAYIPYGEVFVEQRNGSWSTPYLFKAKELDEETGLYYYGARYLDPTNVAWLSVDPLFEKYVGMTPYNYCAGNPVKLVDVDGEDNYYFDEDGTTIGIIRKTGDDKWFVIKTMQTTEIMYNEESAENGNSNPITSDQAMDARSRIWDACNRGSERDIPTNLIQEIPNQSQFDASWDFIQDDGKGGTTPNNNREYNWNYRRKFDARHNTIGWEVYFGEMSNVADPSADAIISSHPKGNHTHPSGTNNGHSWVQPPSKTDIENLSEGGRPKRVWGMRSRTIYIYDNTGVIATIPFSAYGK
jgi:RHS repeat-associated protein